ncbi:MULTISPECIES: ParB/RepB/Spo0J family partition protein [unclassified Shinella]|jgi:ParB family chromosome partitioning protein|uniref:ParB/RepB/Spo0J family partition protein n=1 Tax=unclassified Shinella TaxID=2643062 RepID=UPI0003C53440|nr:MULTISPECIES: ParB/RepB/Spo0J family partition protein [unclassified Shinella]MCA0345361.1 ParB/RepB/Spo0J family partition protein [Pseudomonadota bacterium]EYR78851.1 chromosome-partitioning protein ParB [Shinella sp. DD12]KNY14987.1 chromosome partitioning protein ParB [Shinella sp. SUS2]KOC74639.1 chromosome partitioning protein ParB [Shinella sp. GWS1]MCO5154372.1 ParB/RepB/Spo0J family partition protein [Shinella sp.]
MNEDNSKRRLGRGLAALIGEMDQLPATDVGERPAVNPDRLVPIEFVGRNPRNPRRYFDESELQDLASSIRQHGIVQPVVVRTTADNRYEIIAGERRWRAAQLAGLTDIPVIIRDVDDRTALEIAIVENVQRSDLNPLEEAMGYELLIADHGYTQNDLGEIIGKSRSHVANSLRLLKLPEPVRDMLASGSLSAGHARALIPTSDPIALAKSVVAKGMSVRDTERLAQNDIKAQSDPNHGQAQRKDEKDADTLALERTLSDVLGLDVTVNHKGSGGQLRIAYKTLEQLEEICRLLERR